jgi:hypothetical protein
VSSTVVIEVVAAGAVVNLLLLTTRSLARLPGPIRWAWTRTRPLPLGSLKRKGGEWRRWRLAQVLAWYADRPLRVYPFEAGKDADGNDVDASAVSAALSSAMTRIGTIRRSGVDAMSAPVSASSAIEAIADGLKAAPAGGQLAAAALRLLRWFFARGELQLRGHALSSAANGPGLALTISTASGRTIERLTVWAREFEPMIGPYHSLDHGDRADGLLRVAIVGAVWTHFTILSDIWRLREQDLVARLSTSVWRSYAFMQIGIECEAVRGPAVARALYARAVDADPRNVVAQFNLASMELLDELLGEVRIAGLTRLEGIDNELQRTAKSSGLNDGVGRPEDPDGLLKRDPLRYQLSYKLVSASLNSDVRAEAEAGLPAGGPWPRHKRVSLGREHFRRLNDNLSEIERTLVLLELGSTDEWPEADSSAWSERRSLLCKIEGPMLVLWAIVLLRVGRSDRKHWTSAAHSERLPKTLLDARTTRAWLIRRLLAEKLTPGQAIAAVRSEHVWSTSRTRFNLACWYADINSLGTSLRELELGLECGGASARWRITDWQLRHLAESYEPEWKMLTCRYAMAKPPADENGHRALPLSIAPA